MFDEKASASDAVAQSLSAAFLLSLAGDEKGLRYLGEKAQTAQWSPAAGFFLGSLDSIRSEIDAACEIPEFKENLEALVAAPDDPQLLRRVFFPEGVGLPEAREERVTELRNRRKVSISRLNPEPLADPGRELLFTSNVLLTVPAASTSIDDLQYGDELKEHIRQATAEDQVYWYDHPIQIGVDAVGNEILYGLRGLDEAVGFERARGNMPGAKVSCVLSTSVTHNGLHAVAKAYIESEIRKAGGFGNLDVFVFTEADTRRLIEEVLVPAAQLCQPSENAARALEVFGVGGEYGRHYSFLKAVAALWCTVKDSNVKATFKIDLDQVFPQRELVAQSGASAFEHFKTPLWGARGTDADGNAVELGMIAGALVNEKDIHKGLFTPDVRFPDGPATLEDRFFFKEAFAADAIKAAAFGNLIGDYIRTIYFSAYARVLNDGAIGPIKEVVNPFTGCFISPIPITVVMMRFCMKAAELFLAGETAKGADFVLSSFPRLMRAMQFAENGLHQQYRRERDGWNLYYDALAFLDRDGAAAELRKKAAGIVDGCRVRA